MFSQQTTQQEQQQVCIAYICDYKCLSVPWRTLIAVVSYCMHCMHLNQESGSGTILNPNSEAGLGKYCIGVGTSPAGPVLAGPLFRRFNETHYKNCTRALRVPITGGPLHKSFLRPCIVIVFN